MNKDKLLIEKPINNTYRKIRRLKTIRRLQKKKSQANKKPKFKNTEYRKPKYILNQTNKSLINTKFNLRWFELEQYSFSWSIDKKIKYLLNINFKGLTIDSIVSIILTIESNINVSELINDVKSEVNKSFLYYCYTNNDNINQYVLKPKYRIKAPRKCKRKNSLHY